MPDSSSTDSPLHTLRKFHAGWFALGVFTSVVLLFLIYRESLALLGHAWLFNDNYGHGLFVPFIVLYLIWLKKDQVQACYGHGSWLGLLVILLGMALQIFGKISTVYMLEHFSLWMVIVGLVVGTIGLQGMRAIAFPLCLLLFTIPLPDFLFQGLTGQLRLISTTLGVGCLQIVGITVLQDGNVIDLGPIQLQVVEACSGLRFLFPLMTLALLSAYFFKDRMWKRVFLFLSSIPIAIGLNGFRIGVIGILVEIAGQGAAEGFLHLFEGWLVFVCGLGILFFELWILKRLWPLESHADQQNSPASKMANPTALGELAHVGKRHPSPRFPWVFVLSLIVIVSLGLFSNHLDARETLASTREPFLDFPMELGSWKGTSHVLDQIFIDTLRFDDYLLADYTQANAPQAPINLYVAYYRSQRSGQSIHSPKTCIPGGGWLITSHEVLALNAPSSTQGQEPLQVNQVLIKKGDTQQLVFYWFQQRQRNLTNEYLVKWYLLWDTLVQQRTDGALIRLTTTIAPGEDIELPKKRLIEFTHIVDSHLSPYIPR